jgi:hypothetical protein
LAFCFGSLSKSIKIELSPAISNLNSFSIVLQSPMFIQ